MDLRKAHDILEWVGIAFFFIAIITAIFNWSIAAFTPLFWLLMAIFFILIIICMEVTMLREMKDKEK